LLVTDSLPPVPSPAVPLETHSIAPLLADAIGRLHRNEDLAGLVVHV
jgi:ribose-phosphate pyrophosphokinase